VARATWVGEMVKEIGDEEDQLRRRRRTVGNPWGGGGILCKRENEHDRSVVLNGVGEKGGEDEKKMVGVYKKQTQGENRIIQFYEKGAVGEREKPVGRGRLGRKRLHLRSRMGLSRGHRKTGRGTQIKGLRRYKSHGKTR